MEGRKMSEEIAINSNVSSSTDSHEAISANITVRAELDAIMEVMGGSGCRIIYRQAGLLDIFENPPEYDFEPCIPRSQRAKVYKEILDLLGLNGAITIWRRMGYNALRYTDEIGHVFDLAGDFSAEEMYLTCLEHFRLALGIGNVIKKEDGSVDFEISDCFQCEGQKTKRPMCSLTAGALQYIADKVFGKNVYRANEKKCKAMGSEMCYYVLEKRG